MFRVALMVVAVFGLVMIAPARVDADKDAEKMAERYVEAVNTHNLDLLDAIVAEDVVSKGEEPGLDALKSRLADTGQLPIFSGYRYEVAEVVAEGDTVAAHLTLTVTIAASGEDVSTDVMVFWHLNDAGKIAEMVPVMDLEPIYEAVGV